MHKRLKTKITYKMKKISIFILIIFLNINFLPLLFSFSNVLYAEDNVDVIYNSLFKNYHIMRDGKIKVFSQLDITTRNYLDNFTYYIPHEYGQNVYLNKISIGIVDEDNQANNYIELKYQPQKSDEQLISYSTNDSQNLYKAVINSGFTKNTKYRILVDYIIYDGVVRYYDIANTYIKIIDSEYARMIENLAIGFSFDAEIFENERNDFQLYEHNNLKQIETKFNAISYIDLKKQLNMEKFNNKMIDKSAYFYLAKDIASHSSINLNIIHPSDWVPLMPIKDNPSGVKNMKDYIENNEQEYIHSLRQNYLYQKIISLAVIIILIFTLIGHLIYLFAQLSTQKGLIEYQPANASPTLLAYVENLKLNARVLYSLILTLASKGYLDLKQNRIYRINESELPNLDDLANYEKYALHWIWQSMNGNEYISLRRFNQSIISGKKYSMEQFLKLRRAIDLNCINLGWLNYKNKSPFTNPFMYLGVTYLILSIVLTNLGNFYLPLILMIPGILLIVFILKQRKYTAKGKQLLKDIKAFKKYLNSYDIDKLNNNQYIILKEDSNKLVDNEKLKYTFKAHLIYAIALDCYRDLLLSMRAYLSISQIRDLNMFEFLGLQKIDNIINRSNNKKFMSKKNQRISYLEIISIINSRIITMQQALNNLSIKIIFPEKFIVNENVGKEARNNN